MVVWWRFLLAFGRQRSNYAGGSDLIHCGTQQVTTPNLTIFKQEQYQLTDAHTVAVELTLLLPHLSNGDVVKNGRRVPTRIQIVVGLQGRSLRCPKLVKEGGNVLWVGRQPFIELGNGYVSNFQLLPGLCFVGFEYLIERLFRSAVVRLCYV
jgi:hypothetical protein